MTARIHRITIYPIKSFGGVDIESGEVLPSGGLQHDRRFAFKDADGQLFNAKNYIQIHRFETEFQENWHDVVLSDRQQSRRERFDLRTDQQHLLQWMRRMEPLIDALEDLPEGGLPDDQDASGPTIISTATLEIVASWFDDMTLDDIRRRLRPNIEVGEVPAFWEDRLINRQRPFCIGEVHFIGTGYCPRCVVPTRDPDSGQPLTSFASTIAKQREETLPPWSDRSQFDHYNCLSTNTRLADPCPGGTIGLGDEVILGDN